MEWEYRKIDLNQHRPQKDEMDMLNAAGGDGWELVGITSNNMAYLKRELEGLAPAPRVSTERTMPSAQGADRDCNDARRGGGAQVIRVKYRDPVTNETWSGRGRMATWLKRRQDAGEDIGKYLVPTIAD